MGGRRAEAVRRLLVFSWAQFVAFYGATLEAVAEEQRARDAFTRYDVDGSNTLEKHELFQVRSAPRLPFLAPPRLPFLAAPSTPLSTSPFYLPSTSPLPPSPTPRLCLQNRPMGPRAEAGC